MWHGTITAHLDTCKGMMSPACLALVPGFSFLVLQIADLCLMENDSTHPAFHTSSLRVSGNIYTKSATRSAIRCAGPQSHCQISCMKNIIAAAEE